MTLNQNHSPATATKTWATRDILLLVFFLISILGMLAASLFISVSTLIQMSLNLAWVPEMDSPLPSLMLAAGLFFSGLLLVPSAWQSLRTLNNKPDEPFAFSPLRPAVLIIYLIIWIVVAVIAQFAGEARSAWLYLPLLSIPGMALPVLLLIRLGTNRLSLGTRQRASAIFGLGLAAGPLLAGILEIIGYLFALLAGALLFVVKPEWQQAWDRLSHQIESTPDLDQVLVTLSPLLMNPWIIALILLVVAVIIPIIEELVKPAGIWLLRKRPPTPSEGFAFGVLSGAGFALLESLLAASSSSSDFGLTFLARIGGGIMHIFNTGLMGWAIARYYQEKKFAPLLRTYLLVILLHGAWNAITIGTVVGGLKVLTAPGQIDVAGGIITAISGFGLVVLAIGVLVALLLFNRRLRPAPVPLPTTAGELPPAQPLG